MATEVDSQEPISLKIKEGEEDRSLTPLNLTFNQHPLGEMKVLESMHNQPLKTTNYVGQTGYKEVAEDIELDNENAAVVKEAEGELFLQSPLLPKFGTEGTSSAKKDYKASDIPNFTGGEMSENKTLMEEQVINQYSDTVATKEASREENLGGFEEDRSKGSQDNEKGDILSEETNESESYGQTVNILEANSCQSTDGVIHKLDMTEDSKMGTGRLPETCDIKVNRNITLSTNIESSEDSLRESNFQSGLDKESELPFISEVEKMNPEAIKASKEIQEDKNNREDVLKNTEDLCTSTKSEPTVKQNEEAVKNGQGATVSTTSINELIEETTAEKSQKTAPDGGGDIDEKDQIFIADKTKNKPEICQDEMESETTAKISKNKAGKQDESTEKIVTADSNMNSRSNDNEDPESTEASTREYKDYAGLAAFVDENNNMAEEHRNTKTSKQNLKRFLDVASEEIQKSAPTHHADIITYSKEKRPTKNIEENLKEEEKERTVHLNEIKGKETSEEKNLSKDDLNENIVIAKVASLHKTANETYETDPLVEEIKQLGCREQDQVSKAVPVEQVCEENKTLTEEEKPVNETYEESRNLETITYSEEKRTTESLEENLKEEENERTVHLNEIKGKEISEEKNLSNDELNENIAIAEVASLHKTTNEKYETDPPVEEIKQLGCRERDQVSEGVPVEQVCEENRTLTEEEKPVNETYKESGNLETITYFEEKRPTESLEKNLKEEEKERIVHLNEIKGKEIPEEKNLSNDDLNENIANAEVASLHKTVNKTYETAPLVEEIKQLGCREQDQVSKVVPVEQVCEENKTLTEDEKPVKETYEEKKNLETLTYSEEKRPIESLEENLEEEEKEKTVHLNEIKRKEIPEENNLLKDDSNENIEIAEVVSLHKTANETYETDPPIEEIKQLGSVEQDQVSKAFPVEQVCEENKTLTEEEKHVNDAYEECGNLETITYSEEKRPTESLEENLNEEEKDRAVHLNEIKGKEIPKEKNVSKDDLNENTEIAEVARLHETANETYTIDPPVQEIKQLGCREQDQVSKVVSVEQVREENKILTEEEKHVNDTNEESKNLETITYFEEKRPTKSLEENLEEEEKERTVYLNEIKEKEILEKKNLSKDDLNENIEIPEVRFHETANEKYETDPPFEEIKQLGCEEQDQVSKAVPAGQICEESKTLTEEEKHVNDAYEESGNLEAITYSEEKRPTESFEENLKEEEKERTIHLNEIKGKEIPEEKNLSKDDSNENIENAEVDSLHETADKTYETDPPIEEIKQLGCVEQDQVSKAVPVEEVCEEKKTLTEKKKHVNDTYEESGNFETITYSEKNRPTKSLEENLDEEEEERTVHLNEIKGKEIPKEKNLSKDYLNENIEIAEVVSLHETANETYKIDPLVEEIKQLGRREQDQVSKAVPVEQVCQENKILTEEEKHVNEKYEESKNLENITTQHTFTEEEIDMQLTSRKNEVDVDELGKACQPNCKEKLHAKDFGGDTDKQKQVQQKGLTATELQSLEIKSDDNEKDTIEDDVPVLSNMTCSMEEADQLSQGDDIRQGSSKEEAVEVDVRDESYRTDNDTMNINEQEISEQLHWGTSMADKDEVTKNHCVNKENGSPDQTTKPTSKETIKCYGDETEMEGGPEITVDDPGNGEKVLMERNKIQDQALEKKIDEESLKEDDLIAQEVHEMLQRLDGSRDIGNQIQEEVGTVKENFATLAGQATQEGSAYGKQNKEKECDIEVQETGEGQGKLQVINKTDEQESSTRSLQKNEIQESSQEVEEKEECDSAELNKETEKQNIVESANQDLHSSAVGKANVEENLKQVETKVMELKEEDNNSETECKEQNFDVTCPVEEAKEKALQEELNPSNGCDTQRTTITLGENSLKETNENLVKNSSESQVFEKVSQEKILEKAEISVTGEAEEKVLNKVEQEDKMQLDNPDLASAEKGLVITELCETRSDDIDIIDKLPEASNTSESKDIQIPKAVTDEMAKEAGEKQEHELQNETHNTLPRSEDEREISTSEIIKDYTTEGTLEVYSELNTESGNTESEESDTSKSINTIDVGKLETPNNAKLTNNKLGIDKSGDEKPLNYRSDEACNTCTNTEKVVTEQDNSAEASKSSLTKYVEIEKAVVELETGDCSHKTEDFSTDNKSTIKEENLELHEQLRSSSELVAQDQRDKALTETSVKDNNIEYSDEKIIIPDPQTGELEMNKDIEEVYGGVELAKESENIIEQIREERCATELQTWSTSAERINKIIESDPVTIVNHEAIDFSENKETASHAIQELNRESDDDTVTKPPEAEIDEGTEKHINITSSALKASEEILKEENKDDTDNCNGKMDTAPVFPVTIVNHEAIDFSENKETASHAIEDLNWESEADTVTKPPEEEIDEGTEKHINITSSALEESGEILKEENKQETDDYNGKMDTAPVKLMTEETSLEEIHLDDNPVLALDSTSDDRSLVLKTAHITVNGAESDNPKLEECFCKVPQLITTEHENPDNESGIIQKQDADEVEKPRTSNAATNSKEQNVEDVIETGESLDRTDTHKVENELNEVLGAIAEPKYQLVEAVIEGDVMSHQPLPTGSSTEQLLDLSSSMPPKEKDHETTLTEKCEDKSRTNDEILVIESSEASVATNAKHETCLLKENSWEFEVSKSECEFTGNKEDDSPDEEIKEESMTLHKAIPSEPEENISKIECTEQNFDATCLSKETRTEAPKDKPKPNQDCKTQGEAGMEEKAPPNESTEHLVRNSKESQGFEKETKEEILEDVGLRVMDITEETSLKKVEQENIIQVNRTGLDSEDKGPVITGLQETGSDDVCIKAKIAEASDLGENKNAQIPKAETDEVSGAGEEIEQERENKTEGSEATTVTSENIEASYTYTPLESDEKEENLLQREENFVDRIGETDMASRDIEKSSVNEKIQDEDKNLCTVPVLNSEKKISESEEVEPANCIKSNDASEFHEDDELETFSNEKLEITELEKSTFEDGKTANKASVCDEACNTATNNAVPEQENSARNSKSSLTEDVEIERAVVEVKAGNLSHKFEGSGTTSASIISEKNVESIESCDQFRSASESVAENQSSKQLPQDSAKDQKSDSRDQKITGQDFQENQIKMTEEVELTSDGEKQINRGRDQTEMIKDVILTEEVPLGYQKTDERDSIKEEIIKEESFPKELQMASRLTEIGNEIKDSEPLPSVNLEATEFSEDTETRNSWAAEWDLEALSNMKLPEEETKTCIEKLINITNLAREISGKTVEEANTGEANDAPVPLKTEETSLEGGHLHKKSVWACDIASDDKNLGEITVDATLHGAGVGSLKFEESSGGISQPATTGQTNIDKEGEIVENSDAEFEVEKIITSDAVSNAKEQVVEDILGQGKSATTGRTGIDKPEEEINEVFEAICEAVIEGDIIPNQTLSTGDSTDQFLEPSSSETRTTEESEQKSSKNNETLFSESSDGSFAKSKELTHLQKSKLREVEVPSLGIEENKQNDGPDEAKKEESINVQDATTTQSEPEENQGEKANEITKNKISNEQSTKEKEVVVDSTVASPDEETFRNSNQEDEVKIVECYGEITNQMGETMKNTIPNEELSDEFERAGAGRERAAEDHHHSSAGNRTLTVSPPQDVHEGENVEEAPIKIDLKRKHDGKDCRETDKEETAPSKEVNSSKVDLVKNGEDTLVAGDKEIMVRNYDVENLDLKISPVTDVVAEEVKEVFEPATKDPSHETIGTYDVQNENENTNELESLEDNTKSIHTPLESALDKNCVQEEQGASAIMLQFSTPSEPLREETEDRENGKSGDEKQHDFIPEEQARDKVSIPEEGICMKDEGEHIKHEEPIDLLTKEGRMKLDEAEIEDGEIQDQNVSSHTNDSEKEASQKVRTVDVTKHGEISQSIDKDSLAIPDRQILIEPNSNESTNANISTGNKDVSLVQQLESGNFLGAELKAKEVECQEEKRMGEECKDITKKTISTDSNKISTPDLLQGSSEGALNVAEDLTKERGLPENKEDLQDDRTETAEFEVPKTGEYKDEDVEGVENKRVDSGSDAPVMVEASKDMNIKVSPHKKSHTSILSGVGSKVKHSIAKVKKVITGKSSHPKPSSPK